MSIRHYIAQAEKTYTYRIKTVVPLTDDAMGRIERVILRYQPLDLGSPRKTMFQKSPLDFPTVPAAEVHMVDVELGLPASGYVLAREITQALGLPEKFVVVRGENDPTELETERLAAKGDMDEAAAKAGETPGALLDLPNYDEAESKDGSELYGDKYNKRFLGYLKGVEDERNEAMKLKNTPSPFGWLDMPKSDVADDAGPTIGTEAGKEDEDLSNKGNLDNDRKKYTRVYQKQGKTFVKSETGNPVRKG